MKLLNENENPLIRTAVTYVIEGEISDEEFAVIKKHCINPVDSERAAWRNRRRWYKCLTSRRT